jgi:hypothetical protein
LQARLEIGKGAMEVSGGRAFQAEQKANAKCLGMQECYCGPNGVRWNFIRDGVGKQRETR